MYKPAVYSLNRPYFIPVYGPAGQIPVFFPPQPYYNNVGIPPDNPMRPFMGPTYLPPQHTTQKPPGTTTMKLNNRFPDLDEDDEPRPIWGTVKPVRPQVRPQKPSQNGQGSGIIPTRPPRPKTTSEIPPLVHQVTDGKMPLNAIDESKETDTAIENIFGGAEDFRPLPARPQTSRPSFQVPPSRTTTVPPRTTTARKDSSAPSNCVWAVVSCCSAANNKVAEECFAQRGCPGPFWGPSPCDSDFAKAAINKALEYYGQ